MSFKKPFFKCLLKRPFLKSFSEFATILFVLCYDFFGLETHGILALEPGIESAPLALKGEILATGPPQKCPEITYF